MFELKFMEHKEMTTTKNGDRYEKDAYTIGEYNVTKFTTTYANGHISTSFQIRANSDNEWLPEIYYDGDTFERVNPRFTIQTTSYGALAEDDFEAYLNAQHEALSIVKVLTKAFITAKAA